MPAVSSSPLLWETVSWRQLSTILYKCLDIEDESRTAVEASRVKTCRLQGQSGLLPSFHVLTLQLVPLETSTCLLLAADIPAQDHASVKNDMQTTEEKVPPCGHAHNIRTHLLPLRNSVSRKRMPSLAPAFSFFSLSSPSITKKKNKKKPQNKQGKSRTCYVRLYHHLLPGMDQ